MFPTSQNWKHPTWERVTGFFSSNSTLSLLSFPVICWHDAASRVQFWVYLARAVSQSHSREEQRWGSSFPHLPCSCIFAFAAPHHFSNCSVLAALLLLTLLISYSSCFSLWSFPAATDEAWKYSQWINWEANYTGGSPQPSHMFAALLMPLVLSDSPGSLWKRLNACFSLPQSVGVN